MGPLRVNRYLNPCQASLGSVLSWWVGPAFPLTRTWMLTMRCSMTRSPTLGLSTRTSTPAPRSTSGRPMPDRSSNSGVSTVPAEDHLLARAVDHRPATCRSTHAHHPAAVEQEVAGPGPGGHG